MDKEWDLLCNSEKLINNDNLFDLNFKLKEENNIFENKYLLKRKILQSEQDKLQLSDKSNQDNGASLSSNYYNNTQSLLNAPIFHENRLFKYS